jgi:RimJ/RimL family protein N-acetyltransferase
MPGPVYLSGDRVDLRITEREDIDFLQRARSDPDLRTPLTFTEPRTREQIEEFYENTISADNGDANFLICEQGEDEPVGEANLFRVEDGHAELAYWLMPEARGQGYATESASLLVEYAFETRGLHRVWGKVVAFNDASRGVLERLAFSEEGRLRDHEFLDGAYRDVLYYGLLREEWDGE